MPSSTFPDAFVAAGHPQARVAAPRVYWDGSADGIFDNPHQFFRIEGLFYESDGVLDGMVAVDSADHDDRYVSQVLSFLSLR